MPRSLESLKKCLDLPAKVVPQCPLRIINVARDIAQQIPLGHYIALYIDNFAHHQTYCQSFAGYWFYPLSIADTLWFGRSHQDHLGAADPLGARLPLTQHLSCLLKGQVLCYGTNRHQPLFTTHDRSRFDPYQPVTALSTPLPQQPNQPRDQRYAPTAWQTVAVQSSQYGHSMHPDGSAHRPVSLPGAIAIGPLH